MALNGFYVVYLNQLIDLGTADRVSVRIVVARGTIGAAAGRYLLLVLQRQARGAMLHVVIRRRTALLLLCCKRGSHLLLLLLALDRVA